jgi:predicted nucleotidyltransferase component of viral defense system
MLEGQLMDRDQLRRIAGREKVPLGSVEKDYLTSAVLVILSSYPESKEMVFKGGTCIKKVYFPKARFSVDLDFSCPEKVSDKLLENLRRDLASKELYGIQFIGAAEEERRDSGARLSIKHRETSGHPTSVKLDLSFREKVLEKPKLHEVLDPYGYRLPECKVLALSPEEILAEKVRASIARGAPRDAYDIWFLLRHKVKVRWGLVSEKLKALKHDKSFHLELFMSRLEEQRGSWERDLRPLLGQVPDFDRVKAEIEKTIGTPNS